MTRSQRPWTMAENRKLRELLEQNVPYKTIAKILGRTRLACEGHAFREGITKSLRITDEEPLNPKILSPRKCLTCGREFPSLGPQNRMCRQCKKNIDRQI